MSEWRGVSEAYHDCSGLQEGGWTRQTTIRELPTSVELAAVNMRLEEGVIRELHWHKEAEWAYGEWF